MQFMVMSRRLTDKFTDDDFAERIPAETDAVRRLYGDGVVRQIWLRGDIPGACFMVEAENLDVAQAVVNSLPMASSGLSEFTIIPLAPYRGFATP